MFELWEYPGSHDNIIISVCLCFSFCLSHDQSDFEEDKLCIYTLHTSTCTHTGLGNSYMYKRQYYYIQHKY